MSKLLDLYKTWSKTDKNGNKVIQRTGMTKEELPDLVGKEIGRAHV